MKLSFNMSAIVANNELNNSDNKLAESLERLSSGYKINHARDNPAGLAISRTMRAQIRGLSTASDTATTGVSVIETAEGTLSEMQAMVQRMKELSVQASNGTSTTADRKAIQEEVTQLSSEIERLTKDTEFNGTQLLDGSFDLKGYTDKAGVSVGYYSDETYAKEYKLNIVKANAGDTPTVTLSGDFPAGSKVEVDGNSIKITGDGGFAINLDIADNYTAAAGADADVTLDITGMGAMTLQIGANEGQILNVRIPEISLSKMNIDNLDVTTLESAREAMTRVDDGIAYISKVRSRLGAYQTRLESTISSVEATEENLTNAYSRIMDTDMAEEMTEYTKYQTLSQAGISMLSQANERPQKVLQLLQ
ncbi:MAG: flagellin [Lachnospiraceae bacterium]|nr:flagellin [Lachnospiraceae bacterium]